MYRNTVWRDFVSGYTENGRIPEIGRAVQYLGVGRILGINMHLVQLGFILYFDTMFKIKIVVLTSIDVL